MQINKKKRSRKRACLSLSKNVFVSAEDLGFPVDVKIKILLTFQFELESLKNIDEKDITTIKPSLLYFELQICVLVHMFHKN